MTNNKNRFWAFLALLVIVFGFGYLLRYDPWGWQAKTGPAATETANEAETGETTVADSAKTADEKAPAATAETAEKTDDSQVDAGEPALDASAREEQPPEGQVIPSFGTLRVEPDGSTVIAGSAAPGSQLEIVSGDKVLMTTQTGNTGDFAAVFDNPLPPGDYEIALRTRDAGDKVVQSEEVATISVPKDDPSQLLVIVTKPGEPSRLLSQPEATVTASASDMAKPAGEETATVSAGEGTKVAESETMEVAKAETVEPPAGKTAGATSTPETGEKPSGSDDVAMTEKEPAPADSETGSTTGETAAKATETASATPEPATGEAEAGVSETDMKPEAATPSADKTEETETVETVSKPAADETEKAMPAETAGTESEPESAAAKTETAMTESTASGAKAPMPAGPADLKLRIDAVEIEGGQLFVAGSATVGGRVAVFADNEPIGESPVSGSGRFLVEAEKDIPVGDHTISADLRMPGEDAVALRVAVPFSRPEGNLVAAVAREPDAGKSSETPVASPPAAEDEMAKPVKSKETQEPAASEKAASAEADAGKPAAEEMPAKQTEMAAVKVKPAGEPAQMGKSPAGREAAADKVSESPEKLSMTETSKTETGPSVGNASEDNAEADTVEGPAAETVASEQPSESGTSEKGDTMETAAADSSQPPTIVQPALEQHDNSVIIRRGDTLWQISRRIYGRGVRYTTIYLANTDQIKNPDFIEPGQTFMVPAEPLENAEQLHRQRILGHQ